MKLSKPLNLAALAPLAVLAACTGRNAHFNLMDPASEVSPVVSTTTIIERIVEAAPAVGDSRDPRDGLDACKARRYPLEAGSPGFNARPFSSEELARVGTDFHLPYLTTGTGEHAMHTITLGRSTGLVTGTDIPTNNNAQLLFAVDVTLPPREAASNLQFLRLVMDINKVVARGESNAIGTEMLCLLGTNLCSGEAFHMVDRRGRTSPWGRLYNRAFWEAISQGTSTFSGDGVGRIVNDQFSQDIIAGFGSSTARSSSHGRGAGRVQLTRFTDTTDMTVAFDLSNALDFLYDGAVVQPDLYLRKTLYFVAVDDVHIYSANLEMELTEDTCITERLQTEAGVISGPAVPTASETPAVNEPGTTIDTLIEGSAPSNGTLATNPAVVTE